MLRNWKDLLRDEEGMGTVEIILIIVVLVGLVLIFKEQITKIVNSIFSKITSKQTRYDDTGKKVAGFFDGLSCADARRDDVTIFRTDGGGTVKYHTARSGLYFGCMHGQRDGGIPSGAVSQV